MKGNKKIYDKSYSMLPFMGKTDTSVLFSEEVLNEFRKNVGRYEAETGGFLASSKTENLIDNCYFDTHSKNTKESFYYDVQAMSEVYKKWKEKGYITNGVYHSHPKGVIRPSYQDISTAWVLMKFFQIDYFYMPIIQSEENGQYTLYFYVATKIKNLVVTKLYYVLKAEEKKYEYISFSKWSCSNRISELEKYREEECKEKAIDKKEKRNCFSKIDSIYPQNVLKQKVIVSIGTGGARSAIENFARSGFCNFILMDADTIEDSNIATQSVYGSEIGRKKVQVLREKIMDINPNAKVVCIERFLDNDMSDKEFKAYLNEFPNRKAKDYLIMGCTDSFQAQKRSAVLALKYGIPYLACMMYKNGAAAEIIFNYPGVTPSCPRCMLRSRFEKYENGYVNDVDSAGVPIFATERMNALKGYIAFMLLFYHEDPKCPFNEMLDEVKDRNFVWIRLIPNVKQFLGISIFDDILDEKYAFFDETVWIRQYPDSPQYGAKPCLLCNGTGNLNTLYMKWADTRLV